jgi:molybdopterin synthase catalytic subunit
MVALQKIKKGVRMSNTDKKMKKIFIDGPIKPQFIADSIAKHGSKTEIGAHQIFLGQIRSDKIEDKLVKAIEFTSYIAMAEEAYHHIRELIFSKYDITCMHVYHSLGIIKAGEINLFVFISSRHRRDAIEACSEMVELIKTSLPIWGKEIFEDDNYQWKQNN